MLFRQGLLPGPTLLMRFQRGELNEDQLEKEWEKVTSKKRPSMAFKDVRWPCGRCGKEKLGKEYAPNMQALRRHTLEHTLVEGAWRSCRSCLAKARPAPANTKWCKECEEYLPVELFSGRGSAAAEVCSKHLKTFQQDQQGPVRCSRCKVEQEPTEFHTETLKSLREEGRLDEAEACHVLRLLS